MEQKEKMFDYGMAEWAIVILELEGYDTLAESQKNALFAGKEWFNYVGKHCDLCDVKFQIINDSEIYEEISFIHDEKYYTVSCLIRYTENGLRGYYDDGREIRGFVQLDD